MSCHVSKRLLIHLFRELNFLVVERAKVEVDKSLCPSVCAETRFEVKEVLQSWDNPLLYGQECANFLAANPLGTFIDGIKLASKFDYQDYIETCSSGFSLVQIYFDNPQKTLVTKDAKVTVPDMVSNIGGTIGIFLGLSTVSILDIMMEWMKNIRFFEATKRLGLRI